MQCSFAPVRVLFTPFDRSKILLPFAQKTFGFYKLNNGKFGGKTAFIELCFFFIDLLAFEPGKLCPGVGIFVSFFRPGGRSFALKSCPGGGDFDAKN